MPFVKWLITDQQDNNQINQHTSDIARRRIGMKPRALLATLMFLFVGATLSWGATTGSISGVITDAQSGEPVVGVTVMVMGTSLGASTDVDGRYMIINVPVDTYTLQLSSVGYATVEISNVSVSIDLTTYQSQTMSSEATDIGTTIRVVAERKLIMEDKTTSVNIVTRDELLAMPTRGFEEVVGIQNSVVRMNSNLDTRQRGFRAALATANEINMRGGRPSEVAYYVDGFSQQDPLTGISTANINNNAIKEVSVVSGAFSAEYGHVASGIVNVTTNSGTQEYHGTVEASTDNVAGELGYDAFDHNYYSADFGGPIPGTDKGTFFLSGERRYLGDRAPSSKTYDIFTDFDLADQIDDPWQKPSNELGGWSYQGKVDYNFTPNFKFGLSANGSIDKWRRYIHSFMNPQFPEQIKHSPYYDDRNFGINGKITHTLSQNTFYNLSATYFKTTRKRYDGVLGDDLDAYVRGFANPEQDLWQLFQQGDPSWASDADTTIAPGSPEDVITGYDASYFDDYVDRRSSYIGTKGVLTHQLNTGNTIRTGFDVQRHTLRYFRNLTPTSTQGLNPQNLNYYGFDSLGNTEDTDDFATETKHPINIGLFIEDRLEYRGLIINAGIRFDYFDYKALRFRDIHRPFDPDDEGDGNLDESDLEATEKFIRWSPRVGVSFPISDKTQMHLNYGIAYQRPDLQNLYSGLTFTEARIGAGSYFPHPSTTLEPETVTQYEFGLDHKFGDNTKAGITAWFKDVKDLTQIFHVTPAVPFVYDVYSNVDYGTIKGLDFDLTVRRTKNISMMLKYSLLYATGTGSYAGTQYNIAWKDPLGVPKRTNPLDYDQRHSISGVFDLMTRSGEGPRFGNVYPFENLRANILVQAGSGLPYTPTNPYDAIASKSVSQEPRGPINSDQMPWTYTVDLKLQRTFDIGNYQMIPYLVVKNLLDRDNTLSVYEGTGNPYATGYLETPEGQSRTEVSDMDSHTGEADGDTFAYRYDLLQNNPSNYSIPRMIMVGLRMSF
jgi:outer membrane receptor protein involved in Fe transport